MSSGWLNGVCCSPELEKVFFQQLDVAVDGQQRSVHHAGIYQRMLLIIDWHWSETALKNSFWNHGPLPLESFQNTFDLQTNTDFYCEHFRNTVFSLPFTACTGERSLFWLSSPLWLPYQLCVLYRMHDPQSNWDSWQSLGGRCGTLNREKHHQFVHGTPHLPRGPKKGPVSSPTTWSLFDPPHPSLPLLIDGCFEK